MWDLNCGAGDVRFQDKQSKQSKQSSQASLFTPMVLKIITNPHPEHIGRDLVRLFDRLKQQKNNCLARTGTVQMYGDNYWYTVERLFPLVGRERMGFGLIRKAIHDGSIVLGSPRSRIGRQRIEFIRSMRDLLNHGWAHGDLIASNVMKDNHGTWKAIDLESMEEV